MLMHHVQSHVDSVEEQLWLQDQLDDAGLVAFVRNGAILPRISGAADNDLPMLPASGAIPFQSPPNLEVSFTLPITGTIVTGMGIRKGVTLICGGGFHGKSTLLQTLQLGVYEFRGRANSGNVN
jgi:predicted ABC-class ATPase